MPFDGLMESKSNENWRVGELCLRAGDYNAAASRIYYALFQAILTWARAKKGYPEERTSQVHYDMGTHVGVGKKRNVYTQTFVECRTLRETADYTRETPEREAIDEIFPTVQAMREYYLRLAKP